MPMSSDPEKLAPKIEKLHRLADEAGVATPEVIALGGLPLHEPDRAVERLVDLAEIGVTRFVTGAQYGADPAPFREAVEALTRVREALSTRI
jgi:hypothetical protein